MEEPVGRAKVRGHEVEVIQVAAIVISHSTHPGFVVVPKRSGIIGSGEDEAVILRWTIPYIVRRVPIVVRLVPRRAGVLITHGLEMERGHRDTCIEFAATYIGLTSRIRGSRTNQWRCASSGIELRQTVGGGDRAATYIGLTSRIRGSRTNQWRCASSGIELRQTVEGLIWISMCN